MSSIDITHPHRLPMAQAREAVEDVARRLSERFGVASDWRGDTLHFAGSGVDGSIELGAEQLHLQANLGFLLSMMKDPIEAKVREVLAERLGDDAG